MIAIGIDPGMTGAVAAIRSDARGRDREVLGVWNNPVHQVGKKNLPHVKGMQNLLCDILIDYTWQVVVVGIEKQQERPYQSVVKAERSIVRQYGVWEGLVAARDWEYELVAPKDWQKLMLPGSRRTKVNIKTLSQRKAKELYPHIHVGRHDRADALLIASYIERLHGR